MINFHVLTLFPDFFEAFKAHSIIKKGIDKELFRLNIKDIREHAVNRYGQVDDTPFGGGAGMLMRPEPIYDAYKSLDLSDEAHRKVIFFSPKGRVMDQAYVQSLKSYDDIVLICGHYEGIDQRIIDLIVDEQVSIGDFVLTGGELPAMALIDATVRHIDGVLKSGSLNEESFTGRRLEYRQWTKPRTFMGMDVPEVLLSGNHKEIAKFNEADALSETMKYRPDLLDDKRCNENEEVTI